MHKNTVLCSVKAFTFALPIILLLFTFGMSSLFCRKKTEFETMSIQVKDLKQSAVLVEKLKERCRL